MDLGQGDPALDDRLGAGRGREPGQGQEQQDGGTGFHGARQESML
jgi:hypothetical protein